LEDATIGKEKPQYNDDGAGSSFEVLVQFKNESFAIWMNNTKIEKEYDTAAGYGVVNYVQVFIKLISFLKIIQF